MSSYSAIGSGSADAAELAGAFAQAAIFANTTTGTVPGLSVPSGATVPAAQINTLADALASCINSSGGVAGGGSACGVLFAAATSSGGAAPVNVIGAGMNLANNPTLNSASIFRLVGGRSPFQPTLTAAPANLAVQLAQTSGGLSYSASAFVFPAAYLNFPAATQTLTITNNGPLAVGLSPAQSVQIVDLNAGDFSVGTSRYVSPGIPVGQTCAIDIDFTPSASGARSATLLVAFDGVAPQSFALSGNGLAHTGSSLTLSPSSLTFTLAGVPQPVTLTNSGSTPITLGPVSGATETNNCGTMVAAQSICTIEVEATSLTDNPGTTGFLKVIDSGNPGVETIPVSFPTASCNFRPTPLNFGDLALGVTSTALMSSAFTSSYSVHAPQFYGSISGANASDFAVSFSDTGIYISRASVTFTPGGLGAHGNIGH